MPLRVARLPRRSRCCSAAQVNWIGWQCRSVRWPGAWRIRFWPGPLTLVVPKHPDLPAELSLHATIGVRMPDHPVALALLRVTGPLAVTSANRSGEASSVTAQEVVAQLGGRIELILDGGQTPGRISSTVVDCSGHAPVILRQGPISLEDLLQALT